MTCWEILQKKFLQEDDVPDSRQTGPVKWLITAWNYTALLPYETVPNSNLGTSNCKVGATTEPLQAFAQKYAVT